MVLVLCLLIWTLCVRDYVRIFVFIERSGKFQKQKCIFVYEKNKKEIKIRQRLMELS